MKFKGKVKLYKRDEEGKFTKLIRESPNLWVDDSKELTLDFLWGLQSWWNPMDQELYGTGDALWTTTREIGLGESMFSNSSFERASGIKGIPSGEEYDYPVEDVYLVSPEDSFLSDEIASSTRKTLSITRRDQTVEIRQTITVPGDIDVGENIREFGCFLQKTGPTRDPSNNDANKPYTMLCRSALYGTGYYNESGVTTVDGVGAKLCYVDDPYVTADDIELMWIFGEL